MRPRLIKAKIVTGSHRDQEVLIPRIPLTPSDSTLPIKFTRLQFPVRPAFAMTINKAQGQTFEKVGIYLPQPVFSHGQLYVAMSRVGQRSGVRFLIRGGDGTTLNVVYDEIFH
jgi:hypothetical protein